MTSDRHSVPGTPRRIERNLWLFQVYRFLSTSYLFAPVFLLFFKERHLSVTEITLLNSVYCATLLIFEIPTGTLADRWGRKRAMVLGSEVMALGALLDWLGHSFLIFAIGDGLMALGMALSSGSDSAYLYDLLRDAGRKKEYRRLEGTASAAKLVGTAAAMGAGGWLAARYGYPITYLATVLVCLVAGAVAACLEEPPVHWQRPLLRHMVGSLRLVRNHPKLLFAVLFSTLTFTLLRMGMYFYQPYLTLSGLEIGRVGLVLAGLSLVAAWGAHGIERLRTFVGERLLIWSLPALLTLSYLVLGSWFAYWGIALMFLQSVLNGLCSPLTKEMLNREIRDSSVRATVLSVESMGRRVAFGMFTPLAGVLIDSYGGLQAQTGMRAGLFACAGLGAVGLIWMGFQRSHRRPGAEVLALEPATPGSDAAPADGAPVKEVIADGALGLKIGGL